MSSILGFLKPLEIRLLNFHFSLRRYVKAIVPVRASFLRFKDESSLLTLVESFQFAFKRVEVILIPALKVSFSLNSYMKLK